MYRTYIQRIEIALLSYSLVHTDNTKLCFINKVREEHDQIIN